MIKVTLNEHEFELINIIGSSSPVNQRDLSRRMNLSLGMTNMLIRKLIVKGYLTIRQLDKRKVEYILTPQGLSEKMQKSVKYIARTIRSIGLIKERLRTISLFFYDQGVRDFFIIGKSDLASLVDIVLKEMNLADCQVKFFEQIPGESMAGIFLICEENLGNSGNGENKKIDLFQELAQNPELLIFS